MTHDLVLKRCLGDPPFLVQFKRPPNFWYQCLDSRNYLQRTMLPPILGFVGNFSLNGIWEDDAWKDYLWYWNLTIVVDRCHHLQLVYKSNLIYCDISMLPLLLLGQSKINLYTYKSQKWVKQTDSAANVFIRGLSGTLFVASSHLLLDEYGPVWS